MPSIDISISILAFITLVINFPFGFWRESVPKFSIRWFIAVHAAVPAVIVLRLAAGIEWRVTTIAFLVFCYFLGQFLGSKFRRRLNQNNSTVETTDG